MWSTDRWGETRAINTGGIMMKPNTPGQAIVVGPSAIEDHKSHGITPLLHHYCTYYTCANWAS